jgi:hypothetical protein
MKIKIRHYDTLVEIEEESKNFEFPFDNAIVKIIKEVVIQIKELKK